MKQREKKKSPIERFLALTDKEKAAQVRVFDEEFIFEKARPATAEQQRHWDRLRKKKRAGSSLETMSVKLDHDLMKRSDRLAKEQGLSRAELVSRSLRAALALAGK